MHAQPAMRGVMLTRRPPVEANTACTCAHGSSWIIQLLRTLFYDNSNSTDDDDDDDDVLRGE